MKIEINIFKGGKKATIGDRSEWNGSDDSDSGSGSSPGTQNADLEKAKALIQELSENNDKVGQKAADLQKRVFELESIAKKQLQIIKTEKERASKAYEDFNSAKQSYDDLNAALKRFNEPTIVERIHERAQELRDARRKKNTPSPVGDDEFKPGPV